MRTGVVKWKTPRNLRMRGARFESLLTGGCIHTSLVKEFAIITHSLDCKKT